LTGIAGEVSGRMMDGLKNPPDVEGRGEEDNDDGNEEGMMLQWQLNA